jgi:phenylacetic acid degradation operon negative regulatory protein
MAVVLPTTVEVPTRLLIFGMARQDGSVSAADLGPVAEACGQSPEQVRSCLRRLVSENLFVREGVGSQAVYLPTDAGAALIGSTMERHQRAYLQDQQGRGWDQRWRLVSFNVPETRRAARDQLRDRLLSFGGAAIGQGLYVSVHPWEDQVRTDVERLGIGPHVTLASCDQLDVGGTSDARELARQLWPIDDLAERYARFVADHADIVPLLEDLRARQERIADAAFLPGALRMMTAFMDVFADDPVLPPELLPRPWPGRAARDLLVRSRRLALRLRSAHDRPALFRAFDELISSMP